MFFFFFCVTWVKRRENIVFPIDKKANENKCLFLQLYMYNNSARRQKKREADLSVI